MHIDGRNSGDPPYTLLDYFPMISCVIDESHVAVPQLHGQFAETGEEKKLLLSTDSVFPSAADNRPLMFEEIIKRLNQVVFLSATPGQYEIAESSQVVEQIIMTKWPIDPEVTVFKPTTGQIDDLIELIKLRIEQDERACYHFDKENV